MATAAAGLVTRTAPVTDTYFGERLTDPYRWMENPKDPDWLPFLRDQNARTRGFLDAIPNRARLLTAISARTGDAAVTQSVQKAGEALFIQQRPAGANNFSLIVRRAGATRTLVDPEHLSTPGHHVSLDWWQASPDGSHLLYGLSEAGSEDSVAHIMEVATGRVLPEQIPNTQTGAVSWLPDGSGFFYNRLTSPRFTPDRFLDSEVRLHRLGTDPSHDPVLLKRGLTPDVPLLRTQTPTIAATEGSGTAIAYCPDVRPYAPLYTAPLEDVVAGRARWRLVGDFDAEIRGMALQGDALHLLTTRGAERGRIVRTSAANPDFAGARTVVAESAIVLEDIAQAADGVYITTMDGGIQRLRRLDADASVTEISLPFEGAINRVFADAKQPGVFLSAQGWLSPSAIFRVEPGATHGTDTGITPAPAIDLAPYETFRVFSTSRDGTRVPVDLLRRKTTRQDGTAPAFLTAYGSYELSLTPRFQPATLALLDEGAVAGTVHVRGGGEYGPAWHRAGQKFNKPNTWRDLIDACESIAHDRIASRSRLGIYGRSAGGITMGQALNERPDLFAAVIAGVGWHNPLRYVAEENGAGEEEEWGAIGNPDGYRTLKLIDSYQAVRDGTAYPAVLLTTGVTDPRVAPWHVAKMAARLQHATSSKKPILLRVDFDAGHGIGSTRAQTDAETADIYAFFLWQTNVPGFLPLK